MMAKSKLLAQAAFVTALAGAMAACSSSPSSTATATTPPVTNTTAQEDQFGTAFGTDFRASANSEPANVSDGDIVAVSTTNEPANVN